MPRDNISRSLLAASSIVLSFSILSCNDQFSYTKIPSSAQIQYATPSTSMVGKALGYSWETVSSFDVGKQPFDSVSKSTVYLKNAGDLPATFKRIWIESQSSGNIFSVQSLCGSTLAANQDPCAVNIFYNPNTVGSTPGKLHAQYDDGHGNIQEAILPVDASANNLAFLKFQNTSVDVSNDTVGYTISATFNVIYNGASLGAAGLSILPAQGVVISDPTDSSFAIDRSAATTCGSVIRQNCTIKVNFSPSSVGAKGATFNLSYFNGSQVLAMQASVAGTGTTAVTLAKLSASAVNFGNVVLNPRAPKELAVNLGFTGSVPADNVTISLANSSTDLKFNTDPTKTTCLGGSLSSGQSISGNCTLALQYNPSVHGAMSNSIIVNYRSHGQDMPQTVIPVSGYGANPALLGVTSATSLNFNKVPAHKSVSQVFNLQNTGEVAVSVLSAATLSDSTDYKSAFDSSCGTLAPGAKCNMTVSFKPASSSDPNSLASNISFSYDNGRASQTVSGLSATGIGTAALDIEYSSPGASGSPAKAIIDFGNVMIGAATLPAAKQATLSVYGTVAMSTASQLSVSPANLSSPFTFVGGSFPGTGQTCKAPFDPNTASSCGFSVGLVSFGSPTPDVALTQDFTLSYSGDGGSGSGSLAFLAKMTPRVPPVINFAVAPSAFNTVSVNATNVQTFKLQNASPYFATVVKSVALSGDSAFSIISNGCSSGLAANASCTISVQFKPTAAGTFNGALNYTYNDQISDHTISTSFSGTGSANVTLAADATTLDFGSVYVGDTVTSKTVNLTYYGSSSWTPTMTIPAPFKLVSNNCGAPQNCSIVIGLDTTASGVSNTSFDMSYSPGLPVPAKITFTLKANIQFRSPTLAISGNAFPKTIIGSSISQLVTIKNTGVGTATSLSLPSLSAPFAYVAGSDTTCTAGMSLASGASCVVKVSYTPTLVGASSAAFNVNYVNSATSSPGTANANLTATGTQKIQLFAGAYQTCVINELGNAICWGRNSAGQLGQGNANAIATPAQSMTPIQFGSNVKVLKLAVGDSHICALLQVAGVSGKVTCWGSNDSGRLGLGSSTAQTVSPLDSGSNLQLVDLGTDPDTAQAEVAVDIAAGFEHTCAVLQDGKVKCWGGNTSGQLGIGSNVSIGTSSSQMGNALAAANLGGAKAVSVSAGAGHTCVVLSDGATRCWGDNYYGQLGQGVAVEKIGTSASDMASLKNISLGTNANASGILASPGAFTCALLSSGGVKCFGHTGFNESSSNPFWGVLGTCWARPVYNSAAVPCWSSSSATPTSSLGYYSSDMGDNLPELSFASATAAQVAVGTNFGCALLSDKSVRCWGSNEHGQLGIGSNSNVGDAQNEMGANLKAAITASGGVEPISIATGYTHACAVLNNNTVKCWGGYTENATGLVALGVNGDVGGTPTTTVDALPIVYDGRK